MRLLLRFPVAAPPEQVLAGFTRDLFGALAPTFPKLHLLRFDGCTTGDVVAIELQFGRRLRRRWTSLVTGHGELPNGTLYFVDEGQELPAPLRQWQHRHLIEPAMGGGSLIVEDISYGTGRRWLDRLLWPMLWAQFARRGRVYRRWFG